MLCGVDATEKLQRCWLYELQLLVCAFVIFSVFVAIVSSFSVCFIIVCPRFSFYFLIVGFFLFAGGTAKTSTTL